MRYIRDGICTGYIRRRIYISVPAGKKDKKYLIKKSINQSACMNAEIERGRGGKSVFSPNKDLGTRVGDEQGTGKYFPYCKWNSFYLWGKILPGTDDIKMRQAMRQKIRLCRLGKNRFCTQAREKGAQWFTESNMIRVKNFRPTRPPSGSKNVILCFLANMRYIRDGICTGYIRRRIYISVPAGKKDKKYLIKKSINQSACMNAEIERGRGGKSVFSPNKDLGTRVGDEQGTGKYFPYCKWNSFYLWGKMLQSTDDIKMRQAIWTKNQTMPSRQEQTGFSQKPGKRSSVICRI